MEKKKGKLEETRILNHFQSTEGRPARRGYANLDQPQKSGRIKIAMGNWGRGRGKGDVGAIGEGGWGEKARHRCAMDWLVQLVFIFKIAPPAKEQL